LLPLRPLCHRRWDDAPTYDLKEWMNLSIYYSVKWNNEVQRVIRHPRLHRIASVPMRLGKHWERGGHEVGTGVGGDAG
jgi:hypothetical protein